MSSKREDERNEKIIRGLMKLPPNRRCINCNSMGPQYVCTNFWTFVCMTCSGIHREFTHRVKSVSMAKFTSQEVDALQKGGNQRARELFLKSWDSQRQRLPDNSNIDKLREFIKNVYDDKKYAMDKTSDKPPKDPQSLRNCEDDTRRASSYHSYSQSPPYDFQYEERRYGKHAPVLSRKPGSDRGMYDGKLASFLSPSHFSGHVTDDSSQIDIGSPVSDTSRDFNGNHDVLPNQHQSRTSDGAMRTASCGSFGSFDSGSMSFKSENSLGMSDVGFEPRMSAGISLEKSSLPALPQSQAAASFGGLDLFDSSFAPQSVASTAPIGVSWFTEPQQSQIPQSAERTFNLDVVTPISGGWATFDFAQKVPPLGKENYGPVAETFNPFSLDQKASYQDFACHSYSANTQSFESPTDYNQVWKAFEEPDLHTVQSVLQHNEEPHVPGIFSYGDKFPGFRVDEAGSHFLANDHSPTNPFDLPDDDATNLEPGNLFWDMSSLQAALPSTEEPTSIIGGFDRSWFTENGGSLDFIAGQAPKPQRQNMNIIHPKVPVAAAAASGGGNPFCIERYHFQFLC